MNSQHIISTLNRQPSHLFVTKNSECSPLTEKREAGVPGFGCNLHAVAILCIWYRQMHLTFSISEAGVWRSWWRQNNGHSSNSWRSAVIYDSKHIVLIRSNCLSTFDQHICWRDTFHALQTHEPMRMETHESIWTFISFVFNWFQQNISVITEE